VPQVASEFSVGPVAIAGLRYEVSRSICFAPAWCDMDLAKLATLPIVPHSEYSVATSGNAP